DGERGIGLVEEGEDRRQRGRVSLQADAVEAASTEQAEQLGLAQGDHRARDRGLPARNLSKNAIRCWTWPMTQSPEESRRSRARGRSAAVIALVGALVAASPPAREPAASADSPRPQGKARS